MLAGGVSVRLTLPKSHLCSFADLGGESTAANAVRLQLHALAYNLANFMRTLSCPRR
jgi:hypothetical protein